ncbi:hypothetical protein CXB51_010035 [Gossypium anomalum]|uniref:RNase H type-1 domain-containing protein n=1 Tax=Gossypium anomalum TaxID=47600 RepID=A0A8J5ZN47_9ROSI|nr:hypothetical protein CXB51_010035 [Gossypium anomalum]
MECCFSSFSSRGDNSNHWRPLAIGFVKFNMDGSSRGCPRKTGIGGVLGDKNGCVLALFLGPMAEGDAANAKLLAIENGLEIFANSGWVGCKHLVIKSEPMLSISWCSNPGIRPWNIAKVLKQVGSLVKVIGSICFMYVSMKSQMG